MERKFPGRDPGSMKMIESMYMQMPAFNDIFDEDTFYIFMFSLTAGAILLAFVASKYVVIKPVD